MTIIAIEEASMRGLAAIDEIMFCAEQLAAQLGVATEHDAALTALENLICRVDDLPMDVENIRDDAIETQE